MSKKGDYFAPLFTSSILFKFSINLFPIFLIEKMILIRAINPTWFIVLSLFRRIQFTPKSFPMTGPFRLWSRYMIQKVSRPHCMTFSLLMPMGMTWFFFVSSSGYFNSRAAMMDAL